MVLQLGESPFWLDTYKKWLLVNITQADLITFENHQLQIVLNYRQMLSNIVKWNHGFLISLEKDLVFVDFDFKECLKVAIDIPKSFRCNDGAIGPDGKYWFGTMEKAPSGLNGRLFSLDTKGVLVDQDAEIGIPNSFIWLNEQFVLISDSFLQKTFKVELLESGKLDWSNREVWLDLSQTEGTPDGGALDADGNVWLAVWGDASIHKYSPDAVLLEKIELNALQPTSCAFGGDNMDEMLITTATEGMSDEHLNQYPDSGKVLLRKMDVKGKALPVFNLEV
jgi:sugar lactone lactonase YvrE